ncbi:EAL domain-containing protein [Zongyangia hominis]|uniref:EAL domain-containing protein n=1 Tax=Zongyangia hominis TaxID=2763677 RepID=A0A926I9V5_9FIRM|nr:EAL domain-containing protein [Zongyangia hominis]MBC8569566.1 EAL domain-containing protein [Zongyangia hominis]
MKKKTIRLMVAFFAVVLVMSGFFAWAEEAPAETIYVAGNADHYPIEYYDQDAQQFAGVMPDLLRKIGEETGIEFVYLKPSHDREYYVKNLQAEMLSDYQLTDFSAERYGLTYGPVYFSFPDKEGAEAVRFAFTPIMDEAVKARILEGFDTLSAIQREDILLSNLSRQKPPNTKWMLILCVVLAAVGIVAAVILSILLRKNRRKLRNAIYADRMTGYKFGNSLKMQKDYNVLISDENRCSYCTVDLAIENFIDIREVYGYEERNFLLERMSYIIDNHISDLEMFCRISGGNFILILQYISKQRLLDRLQAIDDEVAQMLKDEGREYKARLIHGIYFLAYNDRDMNQTIYYGVQAKRFAQKNQLRYAIYDDVISRMSGSDREFGREARAAFENNEFIAHFQPKVEVRSGQIVGFEALARWQSKKKGLLFPGSFLPLLAQNNLLSKLDFTLFAIVCRILRQRMDEGLSLLYVSCNFSRDSFYRLDFVTELRKIVQEYRVPAELLEVEITESITAENKEEIIAKIAELKEDGFTVTLDNFGSGAASFVDLQRCQLDAVKLDRELVSDMESAKTQSVIQGIVELCHSIGVKVTCEGIETQEQKQLLEQVQCDVAQGYLFFQPMPYEQVRRLVDQATEKK